MFTEEQSFLKFSFKSLADENRLRMIGLLASREHTVRELASLLHVKEPTVSHHLSKLRTIGFVSLRAEGNQRFYRLNGDTLKRFKDAVNKLEELAPELMQEPNHEWVEQLPFTDWEKKIVRDYTYAGRLRQIPAKEKKLLVIIKWLAIQFEPDRTYTEREVNAVITRFHDDYATLRRSLVSYGYMRRERGGGQYWVTPEDEFVPPREV